MAMGSLSLPVQLYLLAYDTGQLAYDTGQLRLTGTGQLRLTGTLQLPFLVRRERSASWCSRGIWWTATARRGWSRTHGPATRCSTASWS